MASAACWASPPPPLPPPTPPPPPSPARVSAGPGSAASSAALRIGKPRPPGVGQDFPSQWVSSRRRPTRRSRRTARTPGRTRRSAPTRTRSPEARSVRATARWTAGSRTGRRRRWSVDRRGVATALALDHAALETARATVGGLLGRRGAGGRVGAGRRRSRRGGRSHRAGAATGAGIAAIAARVSHGLTLWEAGITSRCPAWITDGLCTSCRGPPEGGQLVELPNSRWLIELSESPGCTVVCWVA